MKVMMMIGDQANHRYLCERLSRKINIDTVVIVDKKNLVKKTFLSKLIMRISSFPLSTAWLGMLNTFNKKLEGIPSDKVISVDNVNSESVIGAVKCINPDLVLVSGTNLLGKELIQSIGDTGKIMNLHTGLSPYINGGPNCTNWCLATKNFHLIGNTIMWLDEGIDSGNLIFTERTILTGSESLRELHEKVMNHAHEMYERCALRFIYHKSLHNVAQNNIGEGKTYYTKDWKWSKNILAYINFLVHFNKKSVSNTTKLPKLVSCEEYSL